MKPSKNGLKMTKKIKNDLLVEIQENCKKCQKMGNVFLS